MDKKRKKPPTDVSQLAKFIVDQATCETTTGDPLTTIQRLNAPKEKNPAAVALGRLGGLKGGKARAEKLSAKKRKEIAQKAAKTRWSKR